MLPAGGLYPILDLDTCLRRNVAPLELAARWRDLGLRYFQLRAKSLDDAGYLELAVALRAAGPELALFANDRVDLVLAHPDLFQGLHLGQTDLAALTSDRLARLQRRRAEPDFVLGFSTHNAEQWRRALVDGQPPWSYLAIGPCFATDSKPGGRDPVLGMPGLREFFQEIRPTVRVRVAAGQSVPPLVWIGGFDAVRTAAVTELWAAQPDLARHLPVAVAAIGAALDMRKLTELRAKIPAQ